jgi:hypothetical protein
MTEEINEGSGSIRHRAKAAARRVTEPLTSAADVMTGRNVEHQIVEYSETFTQVVLGLHEDLTAANRRIAELERKVGVSTPGSSEKQTGQLLPSIAAVVIALAALVVVIWAKI